ncbi:hypothetical protein [Solidesulfovibrio sp.]|uniref:hypothetical protein n=1 Tax=Solidesulfovibrio sp. TaxID=2910990 RepID=UPI0026303D4F|nr:hypothetical protein [Solidesulfovibrio sp.]
MSFDAADVLAQLDARLRTRGYSGLTAAPPDSGTDPAPFTTAMSEARRAFESRPRIGYAEDGLPVTGQEKTACLANIEDLAQKAVARGEDPDGLQFLLARLPVHDGLMGPMLGYEMLPLVRLTAPLPLAENQISPVEA